MREIGDLSIESLSVRWKNLTKHEEKKKDSVDPRSLFESYDCISLTS